MRNVSVADAKIRLSELIEQLAQEGEVVITRHGQPVARLLPVLRTRLADHSISAPMPLAVDTLAADLEAADSGLLTLR
jgi:prevent-host-death family protein